MPTRGGLAWFVRFVRLNSLLLLQLNLIKPTISRMSTVTNNPTNDPTNSPKSVEKAVGPVPLTDLPAGGTGLIMRIEEDDHAMLIRLKTMGMHEGRRIRVIRTGSRVIVSCGGTRIGLAAEVARHIRVATTSP